MKASISIVRIWIHLGLIPSADVSLYIWALDYLFFNLLTWGTLLFLGFVFNCVPRCLLFLILYLPLRIYAGGFHAKTKIGCYLISAFTFLFVVLYPADTTIHFYHLVFPCISTCIIYYFSPVSATNKPLDDLEALHYKKHLLWWVILRKKDSLPFSHSQTAKNAQGSGIWCFWF